MTSALETLTDYLTVLLLFSGLLIGSLEYFDVLCQSSCLA